MPRFAVLAALTLRLLTRIVLGQLRSLAVSSSSIVPTSDPQALMVAERFYDAVNAVLAGGDSAELQSLLHRDYVDHSPLRAEQGTFQELESRLAALRRMFPDLRIATTLTTVRPGLVATRLTVTGAKQGTVDGLAFEAELPDGGIDHLRIEGGLIVERWESPAFPFPGHVETLGTLDDTTVLPIHREMRLAREMRIERFSFERFASHTVDSHAGTIILVESGNLDLELRTYLVDGRPNASPYLYGTESLGPGDVSSIASGDRYSLTNTGLGPASVLILTMSAVNQGAGPGPSLLQPDPAPGIDRQLLASGAGIRISQGPVQVAMHRVQIGLGTGIARHTIVEAEMALVLEGEVEAILTAGTAGLLTEQGTVRRHTGALNLPAGQGIAGYPGAEVAYLAAGPSLATILLITITPTGQIG